MRRATFVAPGVMLFASDFPECGVSSPIWCNVYAHTFVPFDTSF